MNLQAQRLHELCEALGLSGIAAKYAALAQAAAKQDGSYSDYLEQYLKTEQQSRQQRTRSVLLKMASFPALKQLVTSILALRSVRRKNRSRHWPH